MIGYLQNAEKLNRELSHSALPKLLHAFRTRQGYALVYEWVEGEVLSTPDYPGAEGRNNPASPHKRFRRLPPDRIIQALNAIYELHVVLEERGYVASDFYDGCMIYDFQEGRMRMCDLDHYVKGAFTLEADRTYGSSRFMAPEEFRRGSWIDHRTTVYNLGAAAFVFLAEGLCTQAAWRTARELYEVAHRAVSDNPSDRYAAVAAFYSAWRQAQ